MRRLWGFASQVRACYNRSHYVWRFCTGSLYYSYSPRSQSMWEEPWDAGNGASRPTEPTEPTETSAQTEPAGPAGPTVSGVHTPWCVKTSHGWSMVVCETHTFPTVRRGDTRAARQVRATSA
jgi:hypothetical protein